MEKGRNDRLISMTRYKKDKSRWRTHAFLCALTASVLNPTTLIANRGTISKNQRPCEQDQKEIAAVLEYVDRNSQLQQALEKMIYSSTNELWFDVHQEEEKYKFVFYDDPSDRVFLQYIDELREDPKVQTLVQRLQGGEKGQIPRFVQRLKAIIDRKLERWWMKYDAEEAVVLSKLREDASSDDYQHDLVIMIESGSEAEYRRRVRDNYIDELTEYMTSLERSILDLENISSKSQAHTQIFQDSRTRQELERTLRATSLSITNARKVLEYGTDALTMIEAQYTIPPIASPSEDEKRKYRQSLASLIWEPLLDLAVRSRVYLWRQSARDNSQVVLQGHTHPIFQSKDFRAAPGPPSSADKKDRTQLVLTALPHQWRIYTVVCGESALAREYDREKNNHNPK